MSTTPAPEALPEPVELHPDGMPVVPLPKMRPSIFVHPQLGELFDHLTVQLYAMGYAQEVFRAALASRDAELAKLRQGEPVAIAEVIDTGDYGANIQWLLNPLPAGTVLYELASPPPAQPTQAEPALRAIFAHWNEFGPEHGFGELMDRLSAVQHTETSEAQAEAFIQAAISNAPEPLRKLGEFLSRVLDEDKWPAAERLLLAIAAQPTREPVQPLSEADINACFESVMFDSDVEPSRLLIGRAIERLITERMSTGEKP